MFFNRVLFHESNTGKTGHSLNITPFYNFKEYYNHEDRVKTNRFISTSIVNYLYLP